MTFNSIYQGITQNLFFGGVAAAILLFFMFRRATAVANTGNKAAMATWAAGPALMVLASVVITGATVGIALPRLQAMFLSAPAQNTLAVGNTLTAALDNFLFSDPGAGMVVNTPMYTSQPTASTGAVTFASQPAPAPAAQPAPVITTNEQAVVAVNALAAKDDAQTYINTFIADNTPVDASIACGGSYTIKPGDSLAKIAKACYGDSKKWTAICRANNIPDCNNVRAGVALVIPGNKPNMALVQAQAPVAWGQQSTTYQALPQQQPIYAQPAQPQAAAPARNLTSEVVIITNADAVAAVNALAPPVVQPTPRPAYILNEVLGKPSDNTGLAYINQFLAENSKNTVASAGN